MKRTSNWAKKNQCGAVGVFMAIALVIVFGLISLQNITSTSTDLYLSNSKQHIEEARQLAYAGLRHYTHNFGNDEAINNLITQHQGNTSIIGECSFVQPLPETLNPQVQLANPAVPDGSRQNVEIRGLIVPYNCDNAISDDNYRATFEIVASVNCSNNESGVGSGCVKRSFVFNREDNDDGNLAYLPSPSPPPPPPPPQEYYEPPSYWYGHEYSNNDSYENNDQSGPPATEQPVPPPSNSKGKQEVGF
ncbi:hypothetical protein [Limnobacter parvus]|uniref:Type 4 fimbrial biogenesis protein PilX N-terminal domain-containing protein n=1 Tax=Limnobacter parvus TaxID=2939690 RepID=A0ABT1XG27_9BURK|nr:hypothetical protein [Limnobacter parvus]MCR2745831.1 hypothetical protein [Limnobacter parvus]